MANLLAQKVQQAIATISGSLSYLINEGLDIEKLYFTGPSTTISGLANSDPVTVSTKLTKLDMVNGIGLIQQMNNFFGNAAVTTGDYNATIQAILYGNDEAPSILSTEVEAVGSRMYLYAQSLIEAYKQAKDVAELYWSSEVGAAVAAISTTTVFYGIDATASELILGITMIDQLIRLVDNLSVTTGDYSASIAKWKRMA